MLVRVDPKTKIVSMLSFPRDWIVNIPGYGPQEITNSFFLNGPKLTIDTIKSVTGISPNYYVSVDFDAFTQTVNAFKGVYVDVDRRYFNLNQNTAGTNFNSIDIEPGYQLMRGQDALEYVRHRHDDDDTYRLARQQLFLREFKVKLDPISIGRNLGTLLNTAKKNLKIIGKKQMSLNDMELYANTLRSIPKNNMVNVRFVGHAHPTLAGRIAVDQSEVDATVEQFLDPDPTQANRAADEAAGKVKKTSTKFDAATIQVEVRNGNGKVGAAADLEQQLVKRGWKNARAHGDAESSDYFDSVIYYGDEGRVEGGRDRAQGARQPERDQAARRRRGRRAERLGREPRRSRVAGLRRRRGGGRPDVRHARAREGQGAAGRREGAHRHRPLARPGARGGRRRRAWGTRSCTRRSCRTTPSRATRRSSRTPPSAATSCAARTPCT